MFSFLFLFLTFLFSYSSRYALLFLFCTGFSFLLVVEGRCSGGGFSWREVVVGVRTWVLPRRCYPAHYIESRLSCTLERSSFHITTKTATKRRADLVLVQEPPSYRGNSHLAFDFLRTGGRVMTARRKNSDWAVSAEDGLTGEARGDVQVLGLGRRASTSGRPAATGIPSSQTRRLPSTEWGQTPLALASASPSRRWRSIPGSSAETTRPPQVP